MNDTLITFQGNVGGDVELRQAGGSPVARFRVACTPRRYVRKDDTWVDDETQWYTVTAWRSLAEHCSGSLRRGDPVFVQGRLRVSTWTSSTGAVMTTYDVDAAVVGHDLNRGTSAFARVPRGGATTEQATLTATGPTATEEGSPSGSDGAETSDTVAA